jgi:Zn-finger nucleic acid-binding protein
MLLCPACMVELHIAERQGVEIDYCPQCRGTWLQRGELDKILERSRRVPSSRYEEEDEEERRGTGTGACGRVGASPFWKISLTLIRLREPAPPAPPHTCGPLPVARCPSPASMRHRWPRGIPGRSHEALPDDLRLAQLVGKASRLGGVGRPHDQPVLAPVAVLAHPRRSRRKGKPCSDRKSRSLCAAMEGMPWAVLVGAMVTGSRATPSSHPMTACHEPCPYPRLTAFSHAG